MPLVQLMGISIYYLHYPPTVLTLPHPLQRRCSSFLLTPQLAYLMIACHSTPVFQILIATLCIQHLSNTVTHLSHPTNSFPTKLFPSTPKTMPSMSVSLNLNVACQTSTATEWYKGKKVQHNLPSPRSSIRNFFLSNSSQATTKRQPLQVQNKQYHFTGFMSREAKTYY